MGNSKVNPRVDFVFKRIFGVEENKDLLMDLINSIVDEKDQVSEIDIMNPYNDKSFAGDKQSVLDIKAKNARTGEMYLIEMQMSKQGFFDKRALYYWSKVYGEQLGEGRQYHLLKKTIGINFLNFNTIAEEENYHNVYKMCNTKSKKEFVDDIEIHFIELNKYDGHHKAKNLLDKWTYFIKEAGENENLPPELSEVDTIKKALRVLETIQMSKSEREEYEARLKWLRDEEGAIHTAKEEGIEEGIEIGIEQGIEQGIAKEKEQTAKNMLNKGLDTETISEVTGLSKEQIEKLRNS